MSSSTGQRKSFLTQLAVGAGILIGAGALIGGVGYLACQALEKKKKTQLHQRSDSDSVVSSETWQTAETSDTEYLDALSAISEVDEDENFGISNQIDLFLRGIISNRDYFSDPVISSETWQTAETSDTENLDTLSAISEVDEDENSGIFNQIDLLLRGNESDTDEAFNLLKKHEQEMSLNPDFLWRYALAHLIKASSVSEKKGNEKKKLLFKGEEYASKALKLDKTNPDAQEYFAMLLGMKEEVASLSDKPKIAKGFHKHLQTAETSDTEYLNALSATSEVDEDENSGIFNKIDLLLRGNEYDRDEAFKLLKKHEQEMSLNPDFLWRYAMAHLIKASSVSENKGNEKKKLVFKGEEYASKALKLDKTNPDAQKWFALLLGMKEEFASLSDKLKIAKGFHKHLLRAMAMKPDDWLLHHALGRFKFELAKLSWSQKVITKPIFGDFTYKHALEHLIDSERLNKTKSKVNTVFLAKCYMEMKDFETALTKLNSVEGMDSVTAEEHKCDSEIIDLKNKCLRMQS